MDEETLHLISQLESRVKKIEDVIFKKADSRVKTNEDYSGLSGGIKLLISNGFFSSPKSVSEVVRELKEQGYHYPLKSVGKILGVNMLKAKLLNRIKENGVWNYVIRK